MLLPLVIFGGGKSSAHTPHDIIGAIEIGRTATEGHYIFIIMQGYRLLRSGNGGSSWKQLIRGLDTSYPFTSIAVAPDFHLNKTLFVSTGGNGIYKSTDAGNSWTSVSKGLKSPRIHLLAISPSFRDDHIVLATDSEGRILKTQNRGRSWYSVIDNSTPVTAVVFAKGLNGRFILAGDQAGRLIRSIDLGESWKTELVMPESGGINCIAAAPDIARDKILMFGTANSGIFRSTDGGRNFSQSNNGLSDLSVQSIVFSPNFKKDSTVYASCWHQAVFVSNDKGSTWKPFDYGLTTHEQAEEPKYFSPQFRDLKIIDRNNGQQTILLAGFDGLFKSADGGKSWTELETESADWIFGLSTSPVIDSDFLIGVSTFAPGVYLARNSALEWSIQNFGLPSQRTGKIEFSPDYRQDQTLFSFIDEGRHFLFLTPDFNHWQSVKLVDKQPLSWKIRILNYLNRKGLPDWLTTRYLSKAEKSRLWMRGGPAFPHSIVFSPDFRSSRTLYVATERRGMFKSADAGKTFTRIFSAPLESRSLLISPLFTNDQTLFVAGRDKGIFKSEDAGLHWRSINRGLKFLARWQKLSADSWQKQGELRRSSHYYNINLAISPDFGNDQTLFAYGGFGLYSSNNAGEFWKPANIETPSERKQVSAMCISPNYQHDQTVIISVKGFGLYKSEDGCKTFFPLTDQPLINNHLIRHLVYSPRYPADRTIFAATEEALFRSQTDGRTWELISIPFRYENDEQQGVLLYQGKWRLIKGSRFSAGNAHYGVTEGSTAKFNFFGTGVSWIGQSLNGSKEANVYLDGVLKDSIKAHGGNIQDSAKLYHISDLKQGPHTLTIEVVDPGDLAGQNPGIEIDAFDVFGRR